MASRIRLRSTGLLVFGSRLVSVVTGLGFLVLVARSLDPAKFGLWEFILDLVTFSAYPVSVLAFRVTRDVARRRMIGKTAIFVAVKAAKTRRRVTFFPARRVGRYGHSPGDGRLSLHPLRLPPPDRPRHPRVRLPPTWGRGRRGVILLRSALSNRREVQEPLDASLDEICSRRRVVRATFLQTCSSTCRP